MYEDGACVLLEFQDEAHEMMQMVEVVQEEVIEIQIGSGCFYNHPQCLLNTVIPPNSRILGLRK